MEHNLRIHGLCPSSPEQGAACATSVPLLQHKRRPEGPPNAPRFPCKSTPLQSCSLQPPQHLQPLTHTWCSSLCFLLTLSSHFPPTRKERRCSALSAALLQERRPILEEEQRRSSSPAEMHTDKTAPQTACCPQPEPDSTSEGVSMDVRMEMRGMSELKERPLLPGQRRRPALSPGLSKPKADAAQLRAFSSQAGGRKKRYLSSWFFPHLKYNPNPAFLSTCPQAQAILTDLQRSQLRRSRA